MTMSPASILLVEDTATDRELTIYALRASGVMNDLRVAEDGQQALDLLFGDEHEDLRPQLILLDLKLPRVSGFDVLRRIRADDRLRLVPVVVLTSSRQDPDIERAYALGATSYIVKPVDFSQFNDAVRQIGYYWLVINEAPPQLAAGVRLSPG